MAKRKKHGWTEYVFWYAVAGAVVYVVYYFYTHPKPAY